MKTNARKLAACTVALTFAAMSQGQISNGSFETGIAYPNGLNIFLPGTPTPWFATSFTPDCYDNTGADGWNLGGIPAYGGMFSNMFAAHGNRFLGFAAGTTFAESFKQVMAPLNPGSSYTITAQMAVDDLGKDSGGTFGGPYVGRGAIDVRINGSSVGQFSQNTVGYTWQTRSVTFIAPNASSFDVEFVAMTDPLTAAPSYMALDNIGIVPEPGSIIAMGAGCAALWRRRIHS